jgi:hypothetical protein
MASMKIFASAAVFAVYAHNAAAQPPLRPNDPPRGVTLPLAEYNRLIDLAAGPPGPAAPPGPPSSPAPSFACASSATPRAVSSA